MSKAALSAWRTRAWVLLVVYVASAIIGFSFFRQKPVAASSHRVEIGVPGRLDRQAEKVPQRPGPLSADRSNLPDQFNSDLASLRSPQDPEMTVFDPRPFPPLPTESEPLAKVLPTLRDRAEHGDAGAACWLGLELLRCQSLHASKAERAFLASVTFKADSAEGIESEIERLKSLERTLLLEHRCESVAGDDQQDGESWLRRAAEQGSLAAMERIVTSGSSATGSFPTAAQVRWEFAQRPRYLAALLRAGSPAVINEYLAELRLERSRNLAQSKPLDLSATDQAILVTVLSALIDDLGPPENSRLSNKKAQLAQLPLPALPTTLKEKVIAQARALRAERRLAPDTGVSEPLGHWDAQQQCTAFVLPPAMDDDLLSGLRP